MNPDIPETQAIPETKKPFMGYLLEQPGKVILPLTALAIFAALCGTVLTVSHSSSQKDIRWDQHRAICPLLKPPEPSFADGARFAQIALFNQPGIGTFDQLFNVSSNWWFEIQVCRGTNVMRVLQQQSAQAAIAQQLAAKTPPVVQVTNPPVIQATNPPVSKTNIPTPPLEPYPVKKVYKEYKEPKVKAEVEEK